MWDYPTQSYGTTPKGDSRFQGVTPAFIVWNLLQRYTKPGDLVVDPMAGSGTTLDVCREEGRAGIGFDISPVREDISKNDSRVIPMPDNCVDMVFIDPPYGDNVKYSDASECIGRLPCASIEYYTELEKVAKEIHRILRHRGTLGWLTGDQWVRRAFTPVGFLTYNMLGRYFNTLDTIVVTRRGQSSHTSEWHRIALERNFYLRGFKYLFIMSKEERRTPPGSIIWNRYK